MQDDIKNYIDNLRVATQEEQKRKSELSIASKIQTAMLPSLEINNQKRELQLFASLKPAKEVGGDFYDFSYLDEDKLYFTVADVSGKGIPASLFMAVTISYIRAYSSKELRPSAIIEKVNDAICKNNETGMFVTVFLGILDIRKKTLTYVNAGHPKPYIFSLTQEPYALESANDPVVGAMEGMKYKDFTLNLKSSESLFIYTDGVNEAFSKDDEQFGYERIVETLKSFRELEDGEKLIKFQKTIERFCKGTQQSDDITMILLTLV
jgi:sigma-B regulation protein RsbU (phosphoserine phosphatase)